MQIYTGQTTKLFHAEAVNRSVSKNARQMEQQRGIAQRRDTADISRAGRAANLLQNLVNRMGITESAGFTVSEEGIRRLQEQMENGTWAEFSEKELKSEDYEQRVQFMNIMENSDNGINRPTIASQLRGTYSSYMNEAIEKGMDPSEDIYEHIVNIHVESLSKAYQDVYQEIVQGYEDGTREVWTQNFEEGADYTEFELDGRTWRFHKLTKEEELDQLNKAYESAASDAAAHANAMIDRERMIAKIMPKYKMQMLEIAVLKAKSQGYEIGSAELAAELEKIREKIKISEKEPERPDIYQMLMKARSEWLQQLPGQK